MKKPAWLTLALIALLSGVSSAETPVEAVTAFEKACVEKDQAGAMSHIVEPDKDSGRDGEYFLQKARRLVENSGRDDRRAEPATSKIEGDFAVVTLWVGPAAEGKKRQVDLLFLRKAGERWLVIPFTNWRKMPLSDEDKASLEKLETWSEAEEEKLSPPEKADWE